MTPENPHHRILDNLTTAVLLIAPDLTIHYVNSAAEALLDASGARVLGAEITQLFTESADTLDTLREAAQASAAFTRRETALTLLSGQQVTVDYVVTPIMEHEVLTGLVMEFLPLDRLLRISREEGLLSSQQNTQVLIRGIAHEIKNPLGGLRGAAQLLAREFPDDRLKDYTDVIIKEADRLRQLVDNMLGPNRAPDLKPINIHAVTERVRYLAEAECAGSAIRICRDYDPSIPELPGDEEQLIQALLNIVSNAIHALSADKANKSPLICIRTRTHRQLTIGSRRHRLVCRIEVTDNGPGIPKELSGSIFLPLVSGRAEGTGLGLPISQSIVNRHQGLIEYDSAPGETVFALNLPLEQDHE